MDGAHDLGGQPGFGPVDRNQTEHFPCPWEARVFSITLACGMLGKWNLDQARSAREGMDPDHYLDSTYYEHWLHGLEALLLARHLVTEEELAGGVADTAHAFSPVDIRRIREILSTGGPTQMQAARPAGYRIGDRVRMGTRHPAHHTRLPGYIRGKAGEIIAHHGAHIFPDIHARSGEKVPEHLYTIEFNGSELWGDPPVERGLRVCVDVFEPYINGYA
ncbi:MAG: nitrile hydratase subunit beta [Gammaproteobacteria bacterium]|nr:nitrile hydratase subunit beta [Gammaproteobacteria bacterium]